MQQGGPGTLTIEGDYQQGADAVVKILATGAAAGQISVLHVTGNATLGGRVEVTFDGGFLPKTGDAFDFLRVDGVLTGQPKEVVFPNVDPAFQADVAIVGGKVRVTALNDAQPLIDGQPASGGCGCGAGAVPAVPLIALGFLGAKVDRIRRRTRR